MEEARVQNRSRPTDYGAAQVIQNPHVIVRLFRRPDADKFAAIVRGEANRLAYIDQSRRTKGRAAEFKLTPRREVV